MTLEDRELLLEEMKQRHNGQTKAFWAGMGQAIF